MEEKIKVTVLSDNRETKECLGEHGLSLYIEHNGSRLLLDAGKSELFYENAKKLGVDIAGVEYAILSHSHYDHADGFETFFEKNKKAKLYIREEASENYFSKHEDELKYIGPKKGMLEKYKDRLIKISDREIVIDDKKVLISHNTAGLDEIGKKAKLFRKKDNEIIPDDFSHEQSLVIKTDRGIVIFNSCSHGGPKNIINEVRKCYKTEKIYAYIGGFHLFRSSDEEVREFVKILKELEVSRIITGHCTGDRAYEIIKEQLGDKVSQMYAGMRIEL